MWQHRGPHACYTDMRYESSCCHFWVVRGVPKVDTVCLMAVWLMLQLGDSGRIAAVVSTVTVVALWSAGTAVAMPSVPRATRPTRAAARCRPPPTATAPLGSLSTAPLEREAGRPVLATTPTPTAGPLVPRRRNRRGTPTTSAVGRRLPTATCSTLMPMSMHTPMVGVSHLHLVTQLPVTSSFLVAGTELAVGRMCAFPMICWVSAGVRRGDGYGRASRYANDDRDWTARANGIAGGRQGLREHPRPGAAQHPCAVQVGY